jgi:hypothetical protein
MTARCASAKNPSVPVPMITYCSTMRFLGRRKPSVMLISGHRSEYLVGVEHYQGILSGRAIGAPLTVELVAEVNNPHDGNAVAGQIDGRVAGYLRRDVASKYRAPIVLANEHGFRLFVQTMVQEREDGLMRPGWLDIPGPEALARWLALPEAERARGFDFSAGKSPATPRSQGRPV